MKKITLFLAAVLIASPAFASVGINNNGVPVGAAIDMFYNCPANTQLIKGSAAYMNCGNLLAAGTANGGYASLATVDTGVPLTYDIIEKFISNAGTTTDTLANGVPGQILNIEIASVVGGGTWAVSPTTCTGFSKITFGAANQNGVLLYINNTVGWVVLSYSGSTLPTITLK